MLVKYEMIPISADMRTFNEEVYSKNTGWNGLGSTVHEPLVATSTPGYVVY